MSALAAAAAWPSFLLGEGLKWLSGKFPGGELRQTIPTILAGVGILVSVLIFAPLRGWAPDLTLAELMLVSGGGATGAKLVHDHRKNGGTHA